MKKNIISILTGAAVLALAPTTVFSQESQISYPSEGDAVLVIEQRGGTEIRVGSPYEYTLHVRNESDQPLHGVKVFQTLPASVEIENESIPSETKQNSETQADSQMNQRADQKDMKRKKGDGDSPKQKGADKRRDGQEVESRQAQNAPQGNRQGRQQSDQQADQQSDRQADRQADQQADRQADRKTDRQADRQADQQADKAPGSGNRQSQQKQQQAREKRQAKTGKSDSQDQMTTRVWSIGMIAPQEEQVIRITGIPTREGELKSCVSATFDRSLCTTLMVTKPELSLVREWTGEDGEVKDQFFICDPINIRYTIRNEGSGSTPEAVITEELPKGLTTKDGQREVSVEVGDLESGQSETFTVEVMAKQDGQFSSRATASAGKLSSQSNAQAIQLNKAEIDVSVECRGTQHVGREVECLITVQNLSDEVPAYNTQVSIPGIDQRLSFSTMDQNIPADVDTFTVGTLSPGEKKSFRIVFSSDEAGDVSSEVIATAYCAEKATANFKTSFEGVPALQIIVVDQKDPVEVDGETVYEISVLNEGTARDANIILTGELPQTLEFVSASGDSKVEADGNKLSFARVKELQPGDSASWLVTVRGTEPGKDDFTVELKSDSGSTSSGEPTTVY